MKRIFSLRKARSCMIFDALSSLRRCTTVTVSPNLVRRGPPRRGVTAADDGDLLVTEEEAITGGTRRDAVAEQSGLVRHAEHERLSPGGYDERPRPDAGLAVLVAAEPDRNRRDGEVDLGGLLRDDLGSESLGLRTHARHQHRPQNGLGEARVVLHLRREHQLAAGLVARGRRLTFNDEGIQVGAGRVDGCRQAGWARTQDDDTTCVASAARVHGSVCRPPVALKRGGSASLRATAR